MITPAPGAGHLDDLEDARRLDMARRLAPVERRVLLVIVATLVASSPHIGLLPAVIATVGVGITAAAIAGLRRLGLPDAVLPATWLIGELAVAAIVMASHGPSSALLILFGGPLLLASVLWPGPLVRIAVALTAILMVVSTAIVDGRLFAHPASLLLTMGVVAATAITASSSRDADLGSRSEAVIDRLTGALNRLALGSRVAEIAHQSEQQWAPVGLVVCDLDHFKQINDTHGHAAGDAVLREAVARMRAALPDHQSVYRLGGEEFAVLLPGLDDAEAFAVAEQLREALSAAPIDGIVATMSVGVASGVPPHFDFDDVFARADAALYRAKAGGRNRTEADEPAASAVAVAVPAQDAPVSGGAVDTELALFEAEPSVPSRRAHHERADDGGRATARSADVDANWLIRDPLERDHLRRMVQRFLHDHRAAYLVIAVSLLACTPWLGPWMLIPGTCAAIGYRVVQRALPRVRRPELALGIAWVIAQTLNAGGILIADGQPLWALPTLVNMVVAASAALPVRGVIVSTAYTAFLMVAVALGSHPDVLSSEPQALLMPLAFLATGGLVGATVGRSVVDHRTIAIVDALTGLLNRSAYEARGAELAHQCRVTGDTLAVLVADLDHFKAVNDGYGHAVGDRVLAEVARRLQANLRSFDSVYRVGGEEFMIVMSGVTLESATVVAERLRKAVRAEPVAGLEVRVSVGVAVEAGHDGLAFESVFEAADAALYDAKRAGRDQVRAARESAPRALAAA